MPVCPAEVPGSRPSARPQNSPMPQRMIGIDSTTGPTRTVRLARVGSKANVSVDHSFLPRGKCSRNSSTAAEAICGVHPLQSFIAQGEESRNLGCSGLDTSGFGKYGRANIARNSNSENS